MSFVWSMTKSKFPTVNSVRLIRRITFFKPHRPILINRPRSDSESIKNHPKNYLKYYRSECYCSAVDPLKFESVCEETLESLCDYFEELVENCSHLRGADVVFGDGVLTVSFGEPHGTYVINRQTPNRQIWLSSPTSGPKRYDFVDEGDGYWVYRHDGVSLHRLLQTEIKDIVKNDVDFSKCSHSLVT